jgi:hypothetical protein
MDAALTNYEIRRKIIERFDITLGESTISTERRNLGFHFRGCWKNACFAKRDKFPEWLMVWGRSATGSNPSVNFVHMAWGG